MNLDRFKIYVYIYIDNTNIDRGIMQNKLDDILKEKGIKKSWLARQLKVSKQTITNWSKGYHYPDLKKAKELSQLLDTKIDKIFFVEEINVNIDNYNTDIDSTG